MFSHKHMLNSYLYFNYTCTPTLWILVLVAIRASSYFVRHAIRISPEVGTCVSV